MLEDVSVQWGLPSHEHEYVIHARDLDTFDLAQRLRGYFSQEYCPVLDRGTRIELVIGKGWERTHTLSQTHTYLLSVLISLRIKKFVFLDYSNS